MKIQLAGHIIDRYAEVGVCHRTMWHKYMRRISQIQIVEAL
jgi:hypothetical protein